MPPPVAHVAPGPSAELSPGFSVTASFPSLSLPPSSLRPPSLSASGSGVPTVVQERLQRRADGSLLSGAPWASRFPHGHHVGVQWRRKAVRMLSGLRVRGKPPPTVVVHCVCETPTAVVCTRGISRAHCLPECTFLGSCQWCN